MTGFSAYTKTLLTICLFGLLTGCALEHRVDIDPSLPGASKDIDWCQYEYHTGDRNDLSLCSLYPLNGKQQEFIKEQIGYSVWSYKRFMKKKGYDVPTEQKVEPQFFFVTMDLLNNRDVFVRTDNHKRIAGRYIWKKGWIFVTKRAFTKKGYTDLPHEMAHWMNDNSGFTGTPGFDDEGVADDFEDFYEDMAPYDEVVR